MLKTYKLGCTIRRMITCGSLILVIGLAAAQDGNAEALPTEPTEEVIVYGHTRSTLRDELHRAEEKVFSIFNSLNSDDQYDIHCEYRLKRLSHMQIRVCEANFVGTLTSEAAYEAFMKRPLGARDAMMLRKRAELLDEMRKLAVERPELLEALSELRNARDALKNPGVVSQAPAGQDGGDAD